MKALNLPSFGLDTGHEVTDSRRVDFGNQGPGEALVQPCRGVE